MDDTAADACALSLCNIDRKNSRFRIKGSREPLSTSSFRRSCAGQRHRDSPGMACLVFENARISSGVADNQDDSEHLLAGYAARFDFGLVSSRSLSGLGRLLGRLLGSHVSGPAETSLRRRRWLFNGPSGRRFTLRSKAKVREAYDDGKVGRLENARNARKCPMSLQVAATGRVSSGYNDGGRWIMGKTPWPSRSHRCSLSQHRMWFPGCKRRCERGEKLQR